MKERKESADLIVKGPDIERWRLANSLTKGRAAEILGVNITNWNTIIQSETLDDPALAMLFLYYKEYPETLPKTDCDVKAFFEYLGFKETSGEDRKEFARLIGREPVTTYRLLDGKGGANRTVKLYIEAVTDLGLPPDESKKVMSRYATIANRSCRTSEKLSVDE